MLQVMSQLLTDLLATKEYDLSVSHEEAFLDIGPSDERIQALRVHLMAALMQYTSTDRDWAYLGRHAYRPILQHFADVTQAWRINGLPGLATHPWMKTLHWSVKYVEVIGKASAVCCMLADQRKNLEPQHRSLCNAAKVGHVWRHLYEWRLVEKLAINRSFSCRLMLSILIWLQVPAAPLCIQHSVFA